MVIALALLLAASEPAVRPELPRLTTEQLNAFVLRRHPPRKWLRYTSEGKLRLKLSSHASYLKVNCLLHELKPFDPPMEFVGNEYRP